MDLQEIALQRLRSQALQGSKFHSPVEVVTWMVAVQGQDYPGGKWGIGLRQPGSTEAEVEQAIGNKGIIRSWVMRGTLHFVSGEDILWLLTLLGPKIIAGNQRRYRELELDEKTFHRSNHLLEKAIQKEGSLTRKEILGVLREANISTEGQRGVYMLQRASLDRLICQGTALANNPSFISLEGFPSRALSRPEALAELAGRYFASRGPATIQDFTWWSGLPAADARTGLEGVRSKFLDETIEGQTYWWAGPHQAEKKESPSAFLLPTFDEFLLAYKDRSASLGVRNFSQLSPTGGMLPGTVVLNGKAVGVWKRAFTKDGVTINIRPFESLSKAEEANAASAADEFGRFLGKPAAIKKDRLESDNPSNK